MADTALSHKARFPARSRYAHMARPPLRLARPHRHGTVTSYLSHAEKQRPLCTIQGLPYNTSREPMRLDWAFAIIRSWYAYLIQRFSCVTKSAFICRGKMTKKLISPSRCNIKYTFSYLPLPIRRNKNTCKEKGMDFRTQNSDCVGASWWLIFHG